MTTSEVASAVQRSSATVLRWARDGDLSVAFIAPGAAHGIYFFERAAVEEFVAKREAANRGAGAGVAAPQSSEEPPAQTEMLPFDAEVRRAS